MNKQKDGLYTNTYIKPNNAHPNNKIRFIIECYKKNISEKRTEQEDKRRGKKSTITLSNTTEQHQTVD